ncbi:MAG: 5'-methylthioadenosine/S-adenosylhomocysteine nucleosidase [Parabacteroides sp.]|jgi:phosphorylase superfamily
MKNLFFIILIPVLLSCTKEAIREQSKILVVIADENESNYVPTDSRIEVLYTGIGKLNALMTLSYYFDSLQINKSQYIILNIGTCGSPHFPIGSIVIPDKIFQGDTYIDKDFEKHTTVYSNGILSMDLFKNYPHAEGVLTSDQFIDISSELYKKLQNKKYIFEMEAYAIANYADSHNIPFYCIKCISDNCDGTIKDWEKILDKLRPDIDESITKFCNELLYNTK